MAVTFKVPTPTPPTVNGFVDLEFVARGGEAVIWRAVDANKRLVAIKQHHDASQWRTESTALRAIDSENVVRWIGEDAAQLVIVRDYIDGERADRIKPVADDCRRWILDSTRALRDINAAGYTPPDLQLVNIVISAGDRRAVVIDLGHAQLLEPGWHGVGALTDIALRWLGYAHTSADDESVRARVLRELDPALAYVIEDLHTDNPIGEFVERLSTSA